MLALQANTRLGFSDKVTLPPALASAMPPCRLLVVDDDEWMRLYLASMLRSASYDVSVVDSGREALQLMRCGSYDILLTDCQMPGMDGLTLCERVRAEFPDRVPYILMFTVRDTRQDRYAGLNSGADEYIIKGTPLREVLAKLNVGRRIRVRQYPFDRREVPGRPQGLVDPLTNAHNANYFSRQVAKEIERAQCRRRSLSLLSCRIERLEQIAARYGRAASDETVRAFADDIRQSLRPGQDWFARIAADRFVLVLPRTGFNGAERRARLLLRRIAAGPVTVAGSLRCTVHIDVTAGGSWLDWTAMQEFSPDLRCPDAGLH